MRSSWGNLLVERAQPWLGTLVTIRVEELPKFDVQAAIDNAFKQIGAVHRLMSFHDRDSDVGRLNREAFLHPISVHPWTFEVLASALAIAARSSGCFDICIASQLVAWRFLPKPCAATPSGEGSWRDIELMQDGRIAFHRPLWIDLGGIAKGYAVDRAIQSLNLAGALHAVVNAGGDIGVHGDHPEYIGFDLDYRPDPAPVLTLTNGSVASSSGYRTRRLLNGRFCGPHIHGVSRQPASTQRFVSVVASRCIVADALTKVVMAEGRSSENVLAHFGASAHFHDPLTGWTHLDAGKLDR